VLDLAQGLLSEPAFQEGSDAVVYSFALGKGLDTGGGLLYTSRPIGAAPVRRFATPQAATLLRAASLRLVALTGTYALLLSLLEREIESDKDFHPSSHPGLPAGVQQLWAARLPAFEAEVERARRCAQALASLDCVRRSCRELAFYFGRGANHLRQILHLVDATRQKTVIQRMRQAGIDCAPAGEALPEEYLRRPAGQFPVAAAFRETAIRLPFLGRLSESRFARVCGALEKALG
jgi:hypothetical protein